MRERARLRRAAGLTQRQLGRKVGKSAATICLWERGEMELSPTDVEQIAQAITEALAKYVMLSNMAQVLGALRSTEVRI